MKQWLQWAVAVIILVQIGCTSTRKSAIKSQNMYLDTNPFGNANQLPTVYDIARSTIFSDSNFATAHVGISIYNAATQQYLYNYQGDKYFVPASNMKLFTCYAAMKNLGDSLVGLKYSNVGSTENLIFISPTADPTFLHPDFKNQPAYDFLRKDSNYRFALNYEFWQENALGKGWAWDDYNSDYMAERSVFPIYGNLIRIINTPKNTLQIIPRVNLEVSDGSHVSYNYKIGDNFTYYRSKIENRIYGKPSNSKFIHAEIPFITSTSTSIQFLKDTIRPLHMTFTISPIGVKLAINIIHSQPTDSLLKPMMHNSDNFFAEQTLLMVSNQKLGVMNEEQIIDTLLKTDFKGLPQKPRWVDGSGLSRYNLITPQDFVWVLNKMKTDFSWQRITTILPTGNQGTLTNYYKNLARNIFAKTGTLSGQVALSGYLITKRGETFVFSVLVNNHQTTATAIRRGVEKFLTQVYEQY
ncbi:MAG: D-alanyl-D-alanine carboxypeptidase [Flavobacterium sp.]|nr:D-alanyl-D-alanine carboxypeptidase [Flavobacterium sp.]